jgi:serine kinase of HPr protein (carbohydrate metabolism regulator)
LREAGFGVRKWTNISNRHFAAVADGRGELSPLDERLTEKSENTLSRFLEFKGAGVIRLKGSHTLTRRLAGAHLQAAEN